MMCAWVNAVARCDPDVRFPSQVPAAKALEAGLVDHVVGASAPDLVEAAVSFARRRLPQVAGGLDALRTGGRLLKVQFQEQNFVVGGSRCEGTIISKIIRETFTRLCRAVCVAAPHH